MSSKYSKEHYEDVAELLKNQTSQAAPLNWIGCIAQTETNATVKRIAYRFADLFAADNPISCMRCRTLKANTRRGVGCRYADEYHKWTGGFDREQFLTACGLESERVESRHLGFHQ